MKFVHSTLYVRDMEESLRFYREIVGLELVRRFPAGPDAEIAFLGDGETKVELIYNKSKHEINAGTDISWGFEVADADEFLRFLESKGVKIYSGPFQPNPHTRFFYVLDPNGMKIQFIASK